MDWQTVGVQLAPILTAFFGLGAAISAFLAIQMRRVANSTSFGYVREQSVARTKWLTILTLTLLLIGSASGALWAVSIQKPDLLPVPVPTGTPTLIPSPTPRTPTATFTPTSTPTITPTATATPVPPDAEVPTVLRTPFPAMAVTAGPDAALVDLVLAAGVENDQPVQPMTNFIPGTEQVYAFFTFDGMARNVPWSHVWYAYVDDGMIEVWSEVDLWPGDAPHGFTWRYLNCQDGRYELHVYVDRRLQQKVPFTVGVE